MTDQVEPWEPGEDYLDFCTVKKPRSRSLENIAAPDLSSHLPLFEAITSDEHSVDENHTNRRVHFNDSAHVVLIPCRQEYVDAGIDLWYNRNDQLYAQRELHEEIADMKINHPKLSFRMILDYLFHLHPNLLSSPPHVSEKKTELSPVVTETLVPVSLPVMKAKDTSDLLLLQGSKKSLSTSDENSPRESASNKTYEEYENSVGLDVQAFEANQDPLIQKYSPPKGISESNLLQANQQRQQQQQPRSPTANLTHHTHNFRHRHHKRLTILIISTNHEESQINANKIKEAMQPYYSIKVKYISSLLSAVRFFQQILTSSQSPRKNRSSVFQRVDVIIIDTNIIIGNNEPSSSYHYQIEDPEHSVNSSLKKEIINSEMNSVVVLRTPSLVISSPDMTPRKSPTKKGKQSKQNHHSLLNDLPPSSTIYLPSTALLSPGGRAEDGDDEGKDINNSNDDDDDFLLMELIGQDSKTSSFANSESSSKMGNGSPYSHIYYYKLTHLLEVIYEVYHNQIMMGILMNSLDTLEILQRIIPKENMIDFFWKKSAMNDSKFSLLPFLLENHYLYYQDYSTSHPYFHNNNHSNSGHNSSSSAASTSLSRSMNSLDLFEEFQYSNDNEFNNSFDQHSQSMSQSYRQQRSFEDDHSIPQAGGNEKRTIIPNCSYDSINSINDDEYEPGIELNHEGKKARKRNRRKKATAVVVRGELEKEKEKVPEQENDENASTSAVDHNKNNKKEAAAEESTCESESESEDVDAEDDDHHRLVQSKENSPGTKNKETIESLPKLPSEKGSPGNNSYHSPQMRLAHFKRIDSMSSEEDSNYFQNTYYNSTPSFPRKLRKAASFQNGTSSYFINNNQPKRPNTNSSSINKNLYRPASVNASTAEEVNDDADAEPTTAEGSADQSTTKKKILSLKMTTTNATSADDNNSGKQPDELTFAEYLSPTDKEISHKENPSSGNRLDCCGNALWDLLDWLNCPLLSSSHHHHPAPEPYSHHLRRMEEEKEDEKKKDSKEKEEIKKEVVHSEETTFSPLKKAFTNDFLINNEEFSKQKIHFNMPPSKSSNESTDNKKKPQTDSRQSPHTSPRQRLYKF
jgi:hypothetical protein